MLPDLRSIGRGFESQPSSCRVQVVNTRVPLSPSSVIWYQSMCGDALRHIYGNGQMKGNGREGGEGKAERQR